MNKSFTLLFLLIQFLNGPAFAQGQVNNLYIVSNKGIPIQDATIECIDRTCYSQSDENGIVSLRKLTVASPLVVISRIGYETKTIDLNNIESRNGSATIILNPKVSTLENVTIKSFSNKAIFRSITDLDIHLRPINNSQEVLRIIPGLFIGQHAGGGKAEQIFLRGFDIDHGTDINITVDGMPVNMVSHAHGQGYADLHFVIPELIDKVNFNKGPYYADKGNFTTAGYVDFKTKNYLENNFLKVEAGQFNTYRAITGINLINSKQAVKNRSLYIAGEASYSDGYFKYPQHFNRYNTLLKYHENLGEKGSITALISHFSSRWNASGQIPQRAVDNGMIDYFGAIDNTEGGKTSRRNASVEWTHKFDNNSVVRNQFYYTNYDFELYSNFTFFKEDSINGDQIRQKEKRSIAGYAGSYQKDYLLGNLEAQTAVGLQARYDAIDNVELSRTRDKIITTDPLQLGNIREANVASYINQKISLSKKLHVSPALRFDQFYNRYSDKLTNDNLASTAAILSPKLNFDYYINNKVHLYVYNGRGFHSNDTRVAVQQKGRKTLPPAWGTDVGGLFKIGKKLVVQSALWYLWLDQEFVYVGDEGVVEAGGQTRRMGVDASARYEVAKNLFADVDLNFASPKMLGTPKEENRIPLAPLFTSVGGLTFKKEKGWNGSLRYRLMGNRPANEGNSIVAKGYCVMDAAVNYTTNKWEAGLAIQNALNVKWKETQFDTESRLRNEAVPVSEIHFTPGTPFFARINFRVLF